MLDRGELRLGLEGILLRAEAGRVARGGRPVQILQQVEVVGVDV